jgi:hypothetical protein
LRPRQYEGTLDSADVPRGVVTRYGAGTVAQFGPFELRREYAL